MALRTKERRIEEMTDELTGRSRNNALEGRHLLEETARKRSLFGRHRGSVGVAEGVDLIEPALDVEPDATTGPEIDR
jgi:hypothetical protein